MTSDVNVCYLSDVFIYGEHFKYQDDIFIPNSNKNQILKQSVVSQLNGKVPGVWVVAGITAASALRSGRAEEVDVDIFIEKSSLFFSKKCKHLVAGKYARFEFQGTWDNYRVFTRMIYISSMKLGLITRRDGDDLIHFKKVEKSLCNELLEIYCEYYIPIT